MRDLPEMDVHEWQVEWLHYLARPGNMLDIPVAVVSSSGEEDLNLIYPTISHDGHEAESHFHSLQQMDNKVAKIQEVL